MARRVETVGFRVTQLKCGGNGGDGAPPSRIGGEALVPKVLRWGVIAVRCVDRTRCEGAAERSGEILLSSACCFDEETASVRQQAVSEREGHGRGFGRSEIVLIFAPVGKSPFGFAIIFGMKSWNEIRKAATAFSKRWKTAFDEKSQAQSFLKEDLTRRTRRRRTLPETLCALCVLSVRKPSTTAARRFRRSTSTAI